ncbi:MAG: histidine phosphatase family protein [Erysipelotrichaceae bacterium]|nr:histidine phosphatase family protein [Erysipelotrichaceae bacterium]
MKKKTIHLIRHAKTDANTLNLIAGVSDRELNETGINELKQLVEKGSYRPVQFCYTSSLKRAIQTKEMIYPDVPWKIDARFDEINFGEYEDTNFDIGKNDPAYLEWITQDNNMLITAPGGEDIVTIRNRLDEGLKACLREMDEMGIDEFAIVGHGNLYAELTYIYLHDNRNIKTRIDTTFPNGLGIIVEGWLNDSDEVELRYLEDIR